VHERPDLKVSGSDISAAAIQVARANADKLNLRVAFDVLPWLPEGHDYDLVIANLPYVDHDLRSMFIPPEYTDYQPHVAVYSGGPDGLAIIREFVARLDISGLVALQHAPSQTDEVRSFFVDPETRFGRTTFGCLKPRQEAEAAQVSR